MDHTGVNVYHLQIMTTTNKTLVRVPFEEIYKNSRPSHLALSIMYTMSYIIVTI
jgi:hypothetical protein